MPPSPQCTTLCGLRTNPTAMAMQRRGRLLGAGLSSPLLSSPPPSVGRSVGRSASSSHSRGPTELGKPPSNRAMQCLECDYFTSFSPLRSPGLLKEMACNSQGRKKCGKILRGEGNWTAVVDRDLYVRMTKVAWHGTCIRTRTG